MNTRTLTQEERQQWLDQVREDILEPNQRICDPHHHLWNHPGSIYEVEQLAGDIGDGHRVESTVFVECMSSYRQSGPAHESCLGETQYVVEQAEKAESLGSADVCAGIVSFADLRGGAQVREVLEKHIELGAGRFRGIRHASAWDAADAVRPSHTMPPPGLLADSTFRKGFAELRALNLSFDAWLFHTQIHELTHLARAFPETRIVLDHLGGPLGIGPWVDQREAIFASWKPDIAELARCQNVFVKLGGVAMPINGLAWHRRTSPCTSEEYQQTYSDWHLHCVECFGAERCMFESNFPVDRASISFRSLFNGFKRIAADMSAEEKDWLFWKSAHDFYRLQH